MRRISVISGVMLFMAAISFPCGTVAKFSDQDRLDIRRIEAYLNSIKSLRSRFIQVSSEQFSEGIIYVEKPNKLRLKYTVPSNIHVFSSGFWLTHVDTELEAIWHVPIKRTAASLFVQDRIALNGDISVHKVLRETGLISLELAQAAEPDSGRIVLVFTDRPLTLRKWQVTDASGVSTSVTLLATEINVSIPGSIFTFDDTKYQYHSQ